MSHPDQERSRRTTDDVFAPLGFQDQRSLRARRGRPPAPPGTVGVPRAGSGTVPTTSPAVTAGRAGDERPASLLLGRALVTGVRRGLWRRLRRGLGRGLLAVSYTHLRAPEAR